MGSHSIRESLASAASASVSAATSEVSPDHDLDWPFGRVDFLNRHELRQAAYEVFFAACRSSPGFGSGRNALNYYPAPQELGEAGASTTAVAAATAAFGSPAKPLIAPSRLKKALGLKATRRVSPKFTTTVSSSPNSPARHKRPLTSAELMRHQMKVSEQNDNRLRKTLMRTLVGQTGRRAETIILPLELLRHLKPSEFNNSHEYHMWQKRQLKTLEAGLLLYPPVPLERSNPSATRLREIIRSSQLKPIDTSKNSEVMRTLCSCVVALAWRGPGGATAETCHWSDGFPLNLHLYLALLHAIFDIKDNTLILDEVDELIELMKKTWSTLGINRSIHKVCFTWVLFQQFVVTGQVEQDLLCASLTMLAEVANDAKRVDKESIHVKILSSTLTSMQGWAEKRLLDYHESFQKEMLASMENVLPLALSAVKILDDEAPASSGLHDKDGVPVDSTRNRIDYYIRSSLRNAFAKVLEVQNASSEAAKEEEEEDEEDDDDDVDEEEEEEKEPDAMAESLLQLVKETEELARKEKENFSPILRRWLPIAAGVAAVTLHNCYGVVLKQYLKGISSLTNEAIRVLQAAGKLEKMLVQMVVEDSVDSEDGGKTIVREMIPYEVDSVILNLMKAWIEDRFSRIKDCIIRAKDNETWNPKSKSEPYAQSAVEIMKLAKETVDDFFEIPAAVSEEMVQDLADGLENLLQEYVTFVGSCGSKQNYIPPLPPLTRCNQDSKISKLWRKASPCRVGADHVNKCRSADGHNPRPSTSRGTQRLYIRLNTLHYVQAHLHSLDKALSLSPRPTPSLKSRFPNSRRRAVPSYFNLARSSIQTATQHVSEVAAYRLIFLDSNCVFYDSLYVGEVANARIRPALRTLKQNLTLLAAILTDRAQPLALKELMKTSFEAFLMVLLAGGDTRTFLRSDYDLITEDFSNLKRMFCTCGEGLVSEDVVEREAELVEGVVALMGQGTEQLVEDFSIVACEGSSLGIGGAGHKVPMPPTTGRWNRTDPNTILRVLCHRNDEAANRFLKRTFQLAKRR